MSILFNDHRFNVHFGDCISHMHAMPQESIDFSVFSPPFPSVFAYTNFPADIGNSEELRGEAKLHLSFFFRALCRVMKPGRVVMVHCQQIVRMRRTGGQGMFDFRGLIIRLGERAGLIYDYDWAVRKNPQRRRFVPNRASFNFAAWNQIVPNCAGQWPTISSSSLCPERIRWPWIQTTPSRGLTGLNGPNVVGPIYRKVTR